MTVIAQRRWRRTVVLLGTMLVSSGVVGDAAARTMQQKLESACAAAVARLCPGTPPSSEAVKACLMRQRSDVDAACMRLIDASE